MTFPSVRPILRAMSTAPDDLTPPTWPQMTRVFGRIGLLSFGGPAAQIALMHDTLVTREKWLDEPTYLRALSLCMLLPGPEAMQLATYAGWRLRGVPGGLFAGLLFVVPGALVIALLAWGYLAFGTLPLVQAAFLGIKATVIIIVLQALLRLAGKALTGSEQRALAIAAFLAIFVLGAPFPLIILMAAGYGAWRFRVPPQDTGSATNPTHAHPIRTLALWGALWAAPIIFLAVIDHSFLLQISVFFSKLAIVTFGGAYAVLAYMTQEVVQNLNWITTGQMIDALGLAETTPGPLILVTEFVAILAGAAQGGVPMAIAAGLICLWVTFVPCFLWIFLAGPYIEQIASRPRLSAALQGITAAVVGVILNLSVWFALHVLFTNTQATKILAIPLPDPATLNLHAFALTVLAGVLLLRVKLPLTAVLLCSAFAAVILHSIQPA